MQNAEANRRHADSGVPPSAWHRATSSPIPSRKVPVSGSARDFMTAFALCQHPSGGVGDLWAAAEPISSEAQGNSAIRAVDAMHGVKPNPVRLRKRRARRQSEAVCRESIQKWTRYQRAQVHWCRCETQSDRQHEQSGRDEPGRRRLAAAKQRHAREEADDEAQEHASEPRHQRNWCDKKQPFISEGVEPIARQAERLHDRNCPEKREPVQWPAGSQEAPTCKPRERCVSAVRSSISRHECGAAFRAARLGNAA